METYISKLCICIYSGNGWMGTHPKRTTILATFMSTLILTKKKKQVCYINNFIYNLKIIKLYLIKKITGKAL